VAIAQALNDRGPAFLISGATRAGTGELTEAVMRFLETGEAPAQGNLEVPVVKPRRAKPVKAKPKAKTKTKPKPKPKAGTKTRTRPTKARPKQKTRR
jgi:hypothetical protein